MENTVIRFMERKDISMCVSIDGTWTEEDFIAKLRERNVLGKVLQAGETIVGFYVYVLQTKNIILLHMAVDKSLRRQGLGTFMLNNIKDKLRQGGRERIIVPIKETFLSAHLFMKANNFKAISVIDNELPEATYVFKFEIVREAKVEVGKI